MKRPVEPHAGHDSVEGAPAPSDWLSGGRMGDVIRRMDWSKSPLGPIESWPQSLRTTVSLCVASNFPISIAWGKSHIQIYNDGYWPICGGKHPGSMGQSFTECWASAWPAIGEAFERALEGHTSYLENQRMFLDRNGYLEESFFTFSFSPIRDETGGVGGLFHPVTETTSRMLSERRTRLLRELGARTGKAKTVEDALAAAHETLADYAFDVPFSRLLVVDEKREVAHAAGGPAGALAPGGVVEATGASRDEWGLWPLSDVVRSRAAVRFALSDAQRKVVDRGPYPEPPAEAFALPILPPGAARPVAVLVAGVSSRLPLNEVYRAFFDLVASAITTAVAHARAFEDERRRAEGLAAIDHAKTAFFSNVSHEFRTPLTLILGPIEDALSTPDQVLAGDALRSAHRNAERMLRLVNALLDFSRLEAGRARAVYEPMDVASITGHLASAFRAATDRAGLALHVDCPPLAAPVYVDREMWEKIVLNLLSNAYKFTFEGAIRVAVYVDGDVVRLRVADSGTGIAEDELPRLFERFHRIQGARSRSHEGSGIGLALVHELVALHRGTVQVESRLGIGTTFTVSIPAGARHLPPDEVAAPRPPAPSNAHSPYADEALRWLPGRGALTRNEPVPPRPTEVEGRILLVDDNADLRDYVSSLLAPRFEVETAPDGLAALDSIGKRRPDLVLSDVMMPGLDGFGLLKRLRAEASTRDLPVILLSARAGEESTVEGLEAGADDYLVKPFSARELRARVGTHLTMARVRAEVARHQAAEEELRGILHARDEFTSVVSHELRTPLTALTLQAERLMRSTRRADEQGAARAVAGVEAIYRQSQRLARLVEAMLDLSRLTRGVPSLRREEADLAALVQDVVRDFQWEAEQARSVIEVREPGPVVGFWDRMRLEVIAQNLLSNAIKFGRDRPIQVDVSGDATTASLSVRDHGAGIDANAQERIFNRFERAVSEQNYGGLGIGLWIARTSAELMSGRLSVESRPGAGATFTLRLPRKP